MSIIITSTSIIPADAGTKILAGTGTSGFFDITLMPVSVGFSELDTVTIINGDTHRAKRLIGFPSPSGPLLWPLQSITLTVLGGEWRVERDPGRWKWTRDVTIYFDAVNGNDDNDGLAPGPGNAVRKMQRAYDLVCDYMDISGYDPLLQGAPEQVYTEDRLNLCRMRTLVGAGSQTKYADHVVTIDGGGSTYITRHNGNGICTTTGILTNGVMVQNMKLMQAPGSTEGGALGVNCAGYLAVGPGMVFQNNHYDMTSACGGVLQPLYDYTVVAGTNVSSSVHFFSFIGGNIQASGIAPIHATLRDAVVGGRSICPKYDAWVLAEYESVVWMPGYSYDGACEGYGYTALDCSSIYTGTGINDGRTSRYFPTNCPGGVAGDARGSSRVD